jgi:transketolase
MNAKEKKQCMELARKVRFDCLRMVHKGKSGHIGSMLSCAEILSVMYLRIMRNISPDNTSNPERDRLVFSKGHGGGALFATLAELGYFPKEWLDTYYQDAGKLSGHISHHVNGVEFSTGSLGHGMPVAAGMAMTGFRSGKKHRIFCVVSDGDCNAGSTWEAIMLAGQHGWDNLVMIIDYNKLQALGRSKDVINLEPFDRKLQDFGWAVRTVEDGHNVEELCEAMSALPLEKGKPTALICQTIKGKEISFMEDNFHWHYGPLTDELYEKALNELEEKGA